MYRFFLFVALCALSFLLYEGTLHAQSLERRLGIEEEPPNAENIARSYYDTCMKQHTNIAPDIANLQCACTAAHLQTDLTEEELLVLDSDGNDAQNVRHKIESDLYIPCMEDAVKALKKSLCLNTPALRKISRKQDVCDCLADTMGSYAGEIGPYIVGDKATSATTRKKDMSAFPNLLSALLESHEFETRDTYMGKVCVQKYTLWREYER